MDSVHLKGKRGRSYFPGRTTATSYDAVGNVATSTNPLGVVTAFVYDALNRRSATIQAYGTSLARTTSTTYDAVNNPLTVTNAIGAVTSNTFDVLNRRTQMVEAYGSSVARTSSTTFDAVSNVLTTTNARGIVTRFGYDALNRRVSQIQGSRPFCDRLSECESRKTRSFSTPSLHLPEKRPFKSPCFRQFRHRMDGYEPTLLPATQMKC